MAIRDFIQRRKVAIKENFNFFVMSNKYLVAGYLVPLIPLISEVRPFKWVWLITCLIFSPIVGFILYLTLYFAGEFGKWLEKPWRKDYKSKP